MTNTVNNIISFVTSNPINWTIVLSFTSVSIAAMVAYINIYKSKKHVSDDELRESNLIIEMKEKSQKLEEKHESLKETANILKIDVEKLKIETNMNIGSIKDLKQDYKEILQRLDDLLKQIVDSLGN